MASGIRTTRAGGTTRVGSSGGSASRALLVGLVAAAVAVPFVGTSVFAQDDAFDPMRYAGCTVRIALVDGERDEKGLQDLEADIEAETGINIELTTLELNTLDESNDQNLRADESAFDIMHVLGFCGRGHGRRRSVRAAHRLRGRSLPRAGGLRLRRLPGGPARVHRLLRRRDRGVRRRRPLPHPGHPQRLGAALLPQGPARCRRHRRADHLGRVPGRRRGADDR